MKTCKLSKCEAKVDKLQYIVYKSRISDRIWGNYNNPEELSRAINEGTIGVNQAKCLGKIVSRDCKGLRGEKVKCPIDELINNA